MISACHHVQLLVQVGSHELFCLGWPQTKIISLSTSLGARIAGMTHHTQFFLLSFSLLSVSFFHSEVISDFNYREGNM
jgi:hypothetical protein